jgi:prepilin-type N-terminal cleavage/methylation domain-containing protein
MQRGFSFVEVLIVIVVFGIVVGIAAMVVANMVDDSKAKPSSVEQAKACNLDQRVFAVAVQAFKLKNQGQVPTSDADIAPLVKQESTYWTVTDSGKSVDRVQPKPGVSLPAGCVNDPKT